MTRPCGCRYVQAGFDGRWYHVVACPVHRLRISPLDQLPPDDGDRDGQDAS